VRVRLVMLVGVEGAGHHFLASIIHKAEGQVLYLKDWAADIFLTPSKVGLRCFKAHFFEQFLLFCRVHTSFPQDLISPK